MRRSAQRRKELNRETTGGMLLIGAHRINHGTFDPVICQDIRQHSRLRVGSMTVQGAGVYAYYTDRVPGRFRRDPFVVFQVLPQNGTIFLKAIRVKGGPYAVDTLFFVLPAAVGRHVPIAVLGFVNCHGLPHFPGELFYA